jgi:two-component system chemotaxis response regulator CheY
MFLPPDKAGGHGPSGSDAGALRGISVSRCPGMRALVVDDSRVVRMILGKTLMELGFEVSESEDGQKAIERLYRGESFDLMLVDWNMPNMNGYEMIRAVRANVLLSAVKIMMVTTETSMDHVRMALEAGANEYLMKPFTQDLLFRKLQLMGIS